MTAFPSGPTPPGVPPSGPAARRRLTRVRMPAWVSIPVLLGVVVIIGWGVVALFAPWLAPYDPLERVGLPLTPPDSTHLLGTDALGRDVFSRTLYGARWTIPLALIVLICGVTVGCVMGALAGFFGKITDQLIMRAADVTLAFPPILLAMVTTAALGPGLVNVGIAVVVVWWPIYARLLRGQVLAVKELDHVEAAVAAGVGPMRRLRKHIVPLAMTPVLINATIDFGVIVLLVAGLSFIGLGATPPTPEWGLMIQDGATSFYQWWIAFGPGLAIFSVVLAFNFVGDGLRDFFDVRTRGDRG